MTSAAPRVFPDRFATRVADNRPAQPVAAGSLWRSHYVLVIFGILICWTLAFFLVDNIFLERVSARFGTETEVATFMGIYSMNWLRLLAVSMSSSCRCLKVMSRHQLTVGHR